MKRQSQGKELDRYICLVCDEPFFVPSGEQLLCPKCGNSDPQSFSSGEPEEETGTGQNGPTHVFHESAEADKS